MKVTTSKCAVMPSVIVRRAVQHYAGQLLPSKSQIRNLDVKVKFVDDGVTFVNPGTFQNEDDSYLIVIDRTMPALAALKAIAHEMVHVAQYHTKRMIDLVETVNDDDELIMFDDQVYNVNEIDYHDLPWEVEAYSNEVKLTSRWLDSDVKADAFLKRNDRKVVLNRWLL